MARVMEYALVVFFAILPWHDFFSACPYAYEGPYPRHTARKEDVPYIKIQKRIPRRVSGRLQVIPYLIHQTHENDTIPTDMAMAVETVVEHNPQYEYHYYNGTERREFIKQFMGETVLKCYDKLNPKAYKADLFRYSMVYLNGGCYADMGTVFAHGFSDVISQSDTFFSTPDQVSVNAAFFCATKRHPIIALAIENIVQRVSKEFYGRDSIDMTGPRLLEKAFKQYYARQYKQIGSRIEEGVYPGSIRLLQIYTPTTQCMCNQILDLRHELLALHKYPRYFEDIYVSTALWHYNGYFQTRTVYDKSISVSADGFSLKQIPAFKQKMLDEATPP